MKESTGGEPIVLDDLKKTYWDIPSFRPTVAVDCVTIGIHAECFGLLGVNGAGKSSIFKMLAGQIIISDGAAYINGRSVTNDFKQVAISILYSVS